MIVGDADVWSDTFPDGLVPRVLDLITETWATFDKPAPSAREVSITHRFKHALKQAKDLNCLPVRLEREPIEDDPETGNELGRIDLKFMPAVSAREEVYLAFECKRLNILANGVRRSLASEYVTKGMMRFVTGQYARSVSQGGMIGYVLDGPRADAIRLVGDSITSRVADLRMNTPASLNRSRLRPAADHVRETDHNLEHERSFVLHHLFLDCLPLSSTSTYEDYALFPEDGRRHELIDGEHCVSPAPSLRHQAIVANLLFALRLYLRSHPSGQVFTAPTDVVLSVNDTVQPDLLFVSNERAEILGERNVQGAPDLMVEILSEGTRRMDEITKRKLYERFGVTEYWVVDPELETVKVYRREGDFFQAPAVLSLESRQTLAASLLPGLEIPLADLFA